MGKSRIGLIQYFVLCICHDYSSTNQKIWNTKDTRAIAVHWWNRLHEYALLIKPRSLHDCHDLRWIIVGKYYVCPVCNAIEVCPTAKNGCVHGRLQHVHRYSANCKYDCASTDLQISFRKLSFQRTLLRRNHDIRWWNCKLETAGRLRR